MLSKNRQCLQISNNALNFNENQKTEQSFRPLSIVCDFCTPKLFNADGPIKRKSISRSTYGKVPSAKADICFEKFIPLTKMTATGSITIDVYNDPTV